jgi:hypothetical protein
MGTVQASSVGELLLGHSTVFARSPKAIAQHSGKVRTAS